MIRTVWSYSGRQTFPVESVFHATKENYYSRNWPQWFKDCSNNDNGNYGHYGHFFYIDSDGELARRRSSGYVDTVEWGDYILDTGGGTTNVWVQDQFELMWWVAEEWQND